MNQETINQSNQRLEKMGIENELARKLLEFKDEGGEAVYDSAFKITDLCKDVFIAKVKDVITEQEAKDIYQKALNRRGFVLRYIENAQEMLEPHYRAQRACNIDDNTVAECEKIMKIVQGE